MAKAELQNGDERTRTKWAALHRSEVVWGQVSSILSLSDPKKCICVSSPPLQNWVGVLFKLPPPVPAPRHPQNQEWDTITSSLIFRSIKWTDYRREWLLIFFNALPRSKAGHCVLVWPKHLPVHLCWLSAKESDQREVLNTLWTIDFTLEIHTEVTLLSLYNPIRTR